MDSKHLDLCAAPGGKTTLLASLTNISLLVSNELIRTRVPVLYENVVKWGCHMFLYRRMIRVIFNGYPASLMCC